MTTIVWTCRHVLHVELQATSHRRKCQNVQHGPHDQIAAEVMPHYQENPKKSYNPILRSKIQHQRSTNGNGNAAMLSCLISCRVICLTFLSSTNLKDAGARPISMPSSKALVQATPSTYRDSLDKHAKAITLHNKYTVNFSKPWNSAVTQDFNLYIFFSFCILCANFQTFRPDLAVKNVSFQLPAQGWWIARSVWDHTSAQIWDLSQWAEPFFGIFSCDCESMKQKAKK